MAETLHADKSGSVRPPPLPLARAAQGEGERGRPSGRAGGTGAADAGRRAWGWVKRRPFATGLALAFVLSAAGAGALVALEGLPDIGPFAPASVADARANAKAHPDDAAAQRDLGHALWSAKSPRRALAAYAQALARDPKVADDRLVANLVAAFGSREQHEAQDLVTRYQLAGAQKGLEALVRSRRHGVRWAAVHALDKLGKGTRANWEAAYILDLDASSCDVRRGAVDKLGAIGTRRALPALRAARADDEKTGGWFRSRCLGDRLDDAERKIQARR